MSTQLTVELVQPGLIELRERPVPIAGEGQLLVRVETALTCGTDVKMYRRGHPRIPLPAPFGHEFAGTVAAAGSGVSSFREGDAVACVPTAPCGECRLCVRGRENLCPHATARIVLGAFGEYVLLPGHVVQHNVFHRPRHISATTAAGLEPLSCVLHGADRIDIGAAHTVLILGDGAISLIFTQIARLRGVTRVLVAGRHAGRLRVAADSGAETTTAEGEDLRQHLVAQGAEPGIVIECVGEPAVWELAHSLAGPGGRVLLYGGCAAGTRASFDTYRVHYEEVDLIGAFHYGRADVRTAFEMLESGLVDIDRLVTHECRLTDIEEAMRLVLTREAIKVAVVP